MFFHLQMCVEHYQFHFLVFFKPLPHTWPTCLFVCLDLDDIKKQQIQSPLSILKLNESSHKYIKNIASTQRVSRS
jgi:hypothetical protein